MPTAVAHDLVQKSLVGEALDTGPVAVFVADDDGKYLAVNAYACELLGYEREELLALRVGDVAVNQGAADDFEALRRLGAPYGRRRPAPEGRRRAVDALPRRRDDGRRDVALHRRLLAGGRAGGRRAKGRPTP